MKGIFKAIARVLRRMMRKLRAGAARVGAFADGVVSGFFGGGYVEEVEPDEIEATSMAEDTMSQDAARQAIQSKGHEWSHGQLVKHAVDLRSSNKPFADVFDDRDPEHRRLHAYVQALDECGLRAIRCMPIGTLERHLDSSEFRAAGLRPIDMTIRMAREEAERAKATPEKKVEKKRSRSTPVSDALSSGRALTLDELIASNRRGALA